MRMTRTWTISLPPDFSRLAERLAREEHRTKSELVREALRLYLAKRGRPVAWGSREHLARAGEAEAFFRERHGTTRLNEDELRREFRGVRRLHDRLKPLAG